MAEKATSIVRVESFLNHTSTGRASATGARRLAHYFAYGTRTLSGRKCIILFSDSRPT